MAAYSAQLCISLSGMSANGEGIVSANPRWNGGSQFVLPAAMQSASLGVSPFLATQTELIPRNVIEYVLRWAKSMPQAQALKIGEEVLSYGELDARSKLLASELKRAGVGREEVVGICAERSIGLAVAALAVMRAGGAYLPLDPMHPTERLAYQVEDAQARVVIVVETENTAQYPKLAEVVLPCSATGNATFSQEADCELPLPMGNNLAYVIYTSGSTGKPKGVELNQ